MKTMFPAILLESDVNLLYSTQFSLKEIPSAALDKIFILTMDTPYKDTFVYKSFFLSKAALGVSQ